MADEIYVAPRSPVSPSGDVIIHSGSLRRISWGGVFAGLFLVLSIQLLLIMLGFGVGLSVFQPGRGLPSPGTIGIDAAAWWVGSYIVALLIGSYAAARLAAVVLRFDGMLHGLVTWAFALLVTLYLLTSSLGGVIGGAFGVVGNAVSAAGQSLKAAVPQVTGASGLSNDQIQQRAQELLQPIDPSRMNNEQAEARVTKDVGTYLAGGSGAQQARNDIIGIMAARLGISRDDAARRFDQWTAQFEQAKSQLTQGAQHVADQAANALSQAALWGFGALLLGAIFSAVGGALGTRPRGRTEKFALY